MTGRAKERWIHTTLGGLPGRLDEVGLGAHHQEERTQM